MFDPAVLEHVNQTVSLKFVLDCSEVLGSPGCCEPVCRTGSESIGRSLNYSVLEHRGLSKVPIVSLGAINIQLLDQLSVPGSEDIQLHIVHLLAREDHPENPIDR